MIHIHSPIRALTIVCYLSTLLSGVAGAVGAIFVPTPRVLACGSQSIEALLSSLNPMWGGFGVACAALLICMHSQRGSTIEALEDQAGRVPDFV